MAEKEIVVHFNLDHEVESKVYNAIKNLQESYQEPDISKALIKFIYALVNSVGECAERTELCESLLRSIIGKKAVGKVTWQ